MASFTEKALNFVEIIKEIVVLFGQLIFFTIPLLFAVITSPIVILISFAVWYLDYYSERLIATRRTLTNFSHKESCGVVERAMTSLAEVRLSENSQIPVELVQAYVYLSKQSVYEINSDGKIQRIFSYDSRKNKIKIQMLSLGESMTLVVTTKLVYDLDNKRFNYYNYLPHWVK